MKSGLLLAPILGASSSSAPSSKVLVVGLYDDAFSGDSAGYEGTSAMTFTLDPLPKFLVNSSIGLNPSWLAASPGGASAGTIFALSESQLYSGNVEGSVASLEMSCDGSIAVTSRQGSGGGAPAYVTVDPKGECLLAANYAGGNVAVHPVQQGAGGFTLGPVKQVMEFGDQAKAHSAVFGPSADALFVPTLGLDQVQQLTFSNGEISPNGDAFTQVAENQGPRHITFHPSLNLAVLLNEGSADAECFVELCLFDGRTGQLSLVKYIPTLPASMSSSNMYPAEVQFTKDGNYVLVSNRDASDEKKDGISVFRLNYQSSEFAYEFVQYAPVGHYPRSMILTDDDLLITGNQKDNSLTVLRWDGFGHLTKIDEDIPIGQSPGFVGVFDLPSACGSAVLV